MDWKIVYLEWTTDYYLEWSGKYSTEMDWRLCEMDWDWFTWKIFYLEWTLPGMD